MLGKRVIKGSKLGQILRADKTGFRRLGHILVLRSQALFLNAGAKRVWFTDRLPVVQEYQKIWAGVNRSVTIF